jgi:hypothetical protein
VGMHKTLEGLNLSKLEICGATECRMLSASSPSCLVSGFKRRASDEDGFAAVSRAALFLSDFLSSVAFFGISFLSICQPYAVAARGWLFLPRSLEHERWTIYFVHPQPSVASSVLHRLDSAL